MIYQKYMDHLQQHSERPHETTTFLKLNNNEQKNTKSHYEMKASFIQWMF